MNDDLGPVPAEHKADHSGKLVTRPSTGSASNRRPVTRIRTGQDRDGVGAGSGGCGVEFGEVSGHGGLLARDPGDSAEFVVVKFDAEPRRLAHLQLAVLDLQRLGEQVAGHVEKAGQLPRGARRFRRAGDRGVVVTDSAPAERQPDPDLAAVPRRAHAIGARGVPAAAAVANPQRRRRPDYRATIGSGRGCSEKNCPIKAVALMVWVVVPGPLLPLAPGQVWPPPLIW